MAKIYEKKFWNFYLANKITLFITALIICVYPTKGQEQKLSGKILDQASHEPVFGATLFYKGKPVSFSDETGYFQMYLKKPLANDSITISHLSFKTKSIPVSELKNEIYIEEKVYLMDEVTVKPLKDVNVLKEIRKCYSLSVPQMTHFSQANYSQLITYKGKPCSYIELFGNLLLLGRNEKYPDTGAYPIPAQLRRTREDRDLIQAAFPVNNAATRVQASGCYIGHALTEIHYFDFCHPLSSKYTGRFKFHLDSIADFNGKTCYLFSYKQKKNIFFLRNKMEGMKGRFWADVNHFNLLKITCSFDRNKIFSVEIIEEYNLKRENLFPENISLRLIHNKNNSDRLKDKILIESRILIDKVEERGCYGRSYPYMIESYLPYLKYNKDFWSKHPVTDSPFNAGLSAIIGENSPDKEFEIGSVERVFENNKKFDSLFKSYSDRTLELLRSKL